MNVDTVNEWWRPIGSWGVMINVIALPWLIYFGTEEITGMMVGIYGTTVSTFLVLAGIRQNAKNEIIDTAKDLDMAHLDHIAKTGKPYYHESLSDDEIDVARKITGQGRNQYD